MEQRASALNIAEAAKEIDDKQIAFSQKATEDLQIITRAVTEILDITVTMLKEYYPVDGDRVYLTGLSMGGFGTWFTAMARPDLFAAIVPICGGGMP